MDKAKITQLLNQAAALNNQAVGLIAQATALVNAPDASVPDKPLSQIIAEAAPGSTVNFTGSYTQNGPIKVEKNLKIVGVGASIKYTGSKDTGLFALTEKVTSFALENVTVIGGEANYVVRSDDASGILIRTVKTILDPATGAGCGVFFGSGVNGVTLEDCSTEFTTVYSFYCGGDENALNNKAIVLRRCKWGKTNSHCMRTYGVDGMLIEDCTMSNPKSASGRQAIKIMNGRNITVRRTRFDGSTRFGRDVNDPQHYKLENVLLEDCSFTDWTRVDSDNVTYKNAVIVADSSGFCFQLHGKTTLDGVTATYIGGKFSNNPHNIISKKNVTFNGVAV